MIHPGHHARRATRTAFIAGIALSLALLACGGGTTIIVPNQPTTVPTSPPAATAAATAENVRVFTGPSGDPTLEIRNISGVDVCYISVSPSTEPNWGDNVLPNALPANETYVYTGYPPDSYDFLAEDCANGDAVAEEYSNYLNAGTTIWEIGGGVFAEGSEPEPEVVEVPTIVPPAATGGSSDTGFRPFPNGFSFANYGGEFPEGNLTIQEARDLFGDQVCARLDGGICTPTPDAQLWVDTMNSYMEGGHCAGFSVLAMRMFYSERTPGEFDSAAGNAASVGQNIPVMQQIAEDWTLQGMDEVYYATFEGTPREVVDSLIQLNQPVDLGLFSDEGGHSVVAYALEDRGGGIYWIWVYDNNWPGLETYVEVDYNANTWRYSLAALNPAEDSAAWTGSAETYTMNYVPYSAYTQEYACPFCTAAIPAGAHAKQGAAGATTLIALTARGILQVIDAAGSRLGTFDGATVNEIQDARVIRMRGVRFNDREPMLVVPSDQAYTVQVSAQPGKPVRGANLVALGSGFAFAAGNLQLGQGQPDWVSLPGDGQQVTYTAGGSQRPVLAVATQHGGVYSLIAVGGVDYPAASSLTMRFDSSTGNVVLRGDGIERDPFSLTVARLDENGTSLFAARSVEPVSGVMAVNPAAWDGSGALPLLLDPDGDGTFDGDLRLDNEGINALLDDMRSGEEIRALFGGFSAYLSGSERSRLVEDLNALSGLGISVDALDELIGEFSDTDQ